MPGSVAEFLEVIGPLTDPRAHGGDPADAFHLVIPPCPASGSPAASRLDARRAARFAELMRRLGYERYGAQGGDLGALLSPSWPRRPEHLAGIHLNAATVGFIPWGEVAEDWPRTAESGRLDGPEFLVDGNAYFQMQASPQTIAYPLADSPRQLGLDRGLRLGGRTAREAVRRDQILTNVMFY